MTAPRVTAQLSVSLDGFYAGARHDDMATWMAGTEAAGFFRVTHWQIAASSWRERLGRAGGEDSTNSDILAENFAAAGAYVMGRRMFDGGEIPWGEEPPFRAPVFVVTHRPREPLERVGTTFTFVTDGLESAVAQAQAAAGDKEVAVAGGGTLVRQVLEAGLLDQLELHVVPTLLGSGMRLFDGDLGLTGKDSIELVPTRVVSTDDVTHLRYDVRGRSELHLDDRGGPRIASASDG